MTKLPILIAEYEGEDSKPEYGMGVFDPNRKQDANKLNLVSIGENLDPKPASQRFKRKSKRKLANKGKTDLPTVPEEVLSEQVQTTKSKPKKECLTLNQLYMRSLHNRNSMAFWRKGGKDILRNGGELTQTSSTHLPTLKFAGKKEF